ncbi:hypothetical protein BpHYR1_022801 [Brachionus plicatilis]|uniref:Glycine zipper domain-containing protein n=1 Tax=Brachionus plicatilis TaxID=10195 RepID=A0A3M7SYS6_BRAPC|nr:hypothetical protein BpHYR1_022801 [Brachionus plicatilis]
MSRHKGFSGASNYFYFFFFVIPVRLGNNSGVEDKLDALTSVKFESNKKTAVAIGVLEGSISGAALGALSGNTLVPGPGLFFGLAVGAAIGMSAGALRTKKLYEQQFIKNEK